MSNTDTDSIARDEVAALRRANMDSLAAEVETLRIALAEAREEAAQLRLARGKALAERDDARAAVRVLHAIDEDVTRTPPAVVAACERLATLQARVRDLAAEVAASQEERDALRARVRELETDCHVKESARRTLHEDRHALFVEIVKARQQLREVLDGLSSSPCPPRDGHE